MDKSRKSCVIFQDKIFSELYYANTLVNMTKAYCQDREFKGQYYGITSENSKKLSDERNEYIAMLDLISDKLTDIFNLNLSIEEQLCLQKNSDNCC